MSDKQLKDLEERLAIALTSEKVKDSVFQMLGLNFGSIIFADSASTVPQNKQTGSSSKPFSSLQKAIEAAEKLSPKTRCLVLVAPNSAFDEDITISGGRMLSILGLGAWTIGNAAGSNFASTTARSVTWDVTQANPTTFRETLVMGSLFSDEMSSTHTAYTSGLEISGNFNINATVGTQSLELHLRSVKVVGNFDTTGTPTRGIQSFFRKCYFDSGFNSPTGLLNIVESTQFDSEVICLQYCRMWQCEIRAGMTASAGIASSALPPAGIFQSTFTGTFTGPASSLRMDGITNYFFKTNGASLAGGATKVILDDLTP